MSRVITKPVYAIYYANSKDADRSAHSHSLMSIWYLVPRKCKSWRCYIQNFKTSSSFCSWADLFESYLVAEVFSGHGSNSNRIILPSAVLEPYSVGSYIKNTRLKFGIWFAIKPIYIFFVLSCLCILVNAWHSVHILNLAWSAWHFFSFAFHLLFISRSELIIFSFKLS